jgi:hypothetical protein
MAGVTLEIILNTKINPKFDGTYWHIDNDFVNASNLKSSSEVTEVINHIKEKAASARAAKDQGLFAAELMIRKPQCRLALLEEYARLGMISKEKAWRVARDTWLNVDEVHSQITQWESFFKHNFSEHSSFMSPHEIAHLATLPEEIKIYRGYDRPNKRAGLSWTMSKFIASQYANRFKSTIIAQAVIHRSDVVGYLSARGHHEIVVKSRDVVINQRAVGALRGEDAMRWVLTASKKGGIL